VSFDQLVIEMTYSIPSLGLEIRIKGNVAGELEVVDESSETSVLLKNRPGVIVEMQQALPKAVIEDLPANCDSCVQIEYELPLTDQSGHGWLNDVQLLASIENYVSSVLGPHFPAGTIAGLRRDATPFEVAHTSAVTSEGELWTWRATEAEISTPILEEGVLDQVSSELGLIDWEMISDSVGHICYQGGGRETLLLESPDGPRQVEIRCPELYLPGQLVPLYKILSNAAAEILEGSDTAPPELPMTLDTWLLYRRTDGVSLTLAEDGLAQAIDSEGSIYTSTITTTQVLSLTNLLLDDSLLESGPSVFFEEDSGNVILLRAAEGVYEIAWAEESEDPSGVGALLDELISWLLQANDQTPGQTQEPTPTLPATDVP
jgi:hypothetical protein